MTWGLEKYAKEYIRNVQDLDKSIEIESKDWRLSYNDAIGGTLLPELRDEFAEAGN